jgi:magnesium transporter
VTTITEGRRPAPLSRVWSGMKTIAEDLTGEDLGDVLELHSDASAWWVLTRDDTQSVEVREVAKALDLDDLALKDLQAKDGRAKYEEVGQARLVISNAVSVDTERVRVTTHPISIIATDRALICLADSSPDFQPARLLSSKDELLGRGGVDAGLQVVLTAVVHTYQTAVDWLERSSDELSEVMFDAQVLTKPQQLHAFKLRKALSELRRATEPMRSVLGDLTDAQPPVAKGKPARDRTVSRHWKILEEQHDRIATAADGLRETLSSVFDTSLALSDVRLNQTVKKLSGWAAIIAVPTLITGFVGMNVAFPLEGTVVGFWVYLGIMVAVGLVLFAVFKGRDWV